MQNQETKSHLNTAASKETTDTITLKHRWLQKVNNSQKIQYQYEPLPLWLTVLHTNTTINNSTMQQHYYVASELGSITLRFSNTTASKLLSHKGSVARHVNRPTLEWSAVDMPCHCCIALGSGLGIGLCRVRMWC